MPTPHKGPRTRINLRVPHQTYVEIARAANAANMTMNDWCAAILHGAAVASQRRQP